MPPRILTATTKVLDIAYEESGAAAGIPVVLLHGFPYDVRQFDEVRDELVTLGRRVLVPYLRGFGSTQYRDESVVRSGQQAALGKDVLDFLDAVGIERAVLAGYDWGGRAACIVAALWPERVRGLVSASGYAIQDIAKNASQAMTPEVARARWYQTYFNMELGRIGLAETRNEFCRLLWKLWSPTWRFSEEEYQRTARSFENADFVDTVIQSYRHRYGNAAGDPAYDEMEARLAAKPLIAAATFVLSGGVDGVEPPPAVDGQRDQFTGWYERKILRDVGHCVPGEAPRETVVAIEAVVSRSE